MTCNISLEGLLTLGGDEDRALADIKVELNDTVYDWKTYIPADADLSAYLESSKDRIEAEITAKELEWSNNTDPDASKENVVRPDIPDYYAMRRAEYPSLREQLGAIWKGIDSAEFAIMQAKIQSVKDKYPKP